MKPKFPVDCILFNFPGTNPKGFDVVARHTMDDILWIYYGELCTLNMSATECYVWSVELPGG